MSKLLEVVKPSDIDARYDLTDTFGHSESETVARNIVIMFKRNCDQWSQFTWTDYKKTCPGATIMDDLEAIDSLWRDGYLKKNGRRYAVTDDFIAALTHYMKKKCAKKVRKLLSEL